MTMPQVATQTAEINQPVSTLIDAIRPFEADDGHKGTYIVLRIAKMDKPMALKLVKRKYRSWQNWRATDEDFYRLDEALPYLQEKFGGEARVLRTALLDISIIETGIMVFQRIMSKLPVSSDMWTYATRMAGLRLPVMGAEKGESNPWERLANSVQNTIGARELTIKNVDIYGAEQTVTAKEILVQSSPEQKQVADAIVGSLLNRDVVN